MSNKPLWYGGLVLVAAGVIWWGLSAQERDKKRKHEDVLEEKVKTYRVFIVEQEQHIKAMNNELKAIDEKALSDQLARMTLELKDVVQKNDELNRRRLMTDMNKLQVELDAARDTKKKLKDRIDSYRESITASKATLTETEKELGKLRGR